MISVDAMGGDRGPEAVVAGLAIICAEPDYQDVRFLLHGDVSILQPLIDHFPDLHTKVTLQHSPRSVTMHDKPAQIMRRGKDTSMWAAVTSVKTGEAQAVCSGGNTGALMAVSMIVLRRLMGLDRPAIAGLWPTAERKTYNILLDIGAEVDADANDLFRFAIMGASYAQISLGVECPRVGLLNVGTEEHKGHPELREAYEMLKSAESDEFSFVGFVEGNELSSHRAQVIVTDGFTGNVALKTGEGTARFISEMFKSTFKGGFWAKAGAFLAQGALRRLQQDVDPRHANGGVFLGLNGTVVKSHGGSDAMGIAAALRLTIRLARSEFQQNLAARITSIANNETPLPSDPGINATPQQQDI